MLLEEFLGFVDLRSQVRAASAIGVVEQHQLAVLLGDLVFSQSALTINNENSIVRTSSEFKTSVISIGEGRTEARGSGRPPGGSCAARILCDMS